MKSRWDELFQLACGLIDQVNSNHNIIDRWTFGGGTAMMLQIDHRVSHDVDIFIEDPQLLTFLNPATQNFTFSKQPSAYQGDGTHFQKIVFDDIGEIDFIVAIEKTDNPAIATDVLGRSVLLETVEEIICKKVYYRGSHIAARDVFDIAAAAFSGCSDTMIEALAHYPEKVIGAWKATSLLNDEFLIAAISALQIKENFLSITPHAKKTCLEVLEKSLAKIDIPLPNLD